LQFISVVQQAPKRLRASQFLFCTETVGQDTLDTIVENIQRISFLCLRVAQSRFWNHKFPAAFADIFESFINEFFPQAIDRFINAPNSLQHVRAGSLRALAVTSATKSSLLPDVPVLADTIPGYEASALFGMVVPKNTPKEIIAKLNKEINEVLAEPAIKARLIDLGGEPLIGTPEAFGAMIVAETDKWKKVIEEAKVEKVQ